MWKYCTFRCWARFYLAISIASFLYVFYYYKASKIDMGSVKCGSTIEKLRNPHLNLTSTWELHLQQLPKFNLMEDSYGTNWTNASETFYELQHCTVEYANTHKLEQDHPCVIHLIRDLYMHKPAPRNLPYDLTYPEILDPSDGQSKGVLQLLQNKTNGFFIECGVYDGEHLSNTLFMERSLNWTGLLIEADKKAFRRLSTRNRKSFTTPVCLSTAPYPMQVLYNTTKLLFSSIIEKKKMHPKKGGSDNLKLQDAAAKESENVYRMQCFSLYSILLAIGRTEIDYFSLDVEGSEFKILKTIPWHKVDIKTLTVEWDHTPEGEAAISQLMKLNKFVKFGHIEMAYSREILYVKDYLDNLRSYE